MTYNSGIAQNLRWGGGNMALTFNNGKVVSPNDRLASFDPQFNSSYLFSYTQPLLRGFKIDQTRQQMQTTLINRDNAELNLKARTTNTLAAVRSAYWDYVFSIQAWMWRNSRSLLHRSCFPTTRFASRSARWRRWTSCRPKPKKRRGSRRSPTAEATMRTAELSLKRLIVSGTNDPLWSQHIDPVDRPNFQNRLDRR